MSNPIRIMIVDDHSQVHRGLGILQDTFTDLLVSAHASNGQEALHLCEEQPPDVILMDVIMTGISGIETTRLIHAKYPNVKILALSAFHDQASVQEMIKAGAVGYVLKNSSLAEVANSIRAAYAGTSVFSAEVTHALFNPEADKPKEDFGLTRREVEILALMVKGYNNKQIAYALTISEPTAKFHVRNIIAKLKVSGRVEAVAVAVQKNLVS